MTPALPRVYHGEASRPGGTLTKEYRIWGQIKRRCLDKGHPKYGYYGGRGITVCDRWRDNYPAFLADMGRCPSSSSTIERIDNARGYEPGNCTWASRKEQARNRRSNRILTYNGKTALISDWASSLGLSRPALSRRLNTLGWSIQRALSTPRMR